MEGLRGRGQCRDTPPPSALKVLPPAAGSASLCRNWGIWEKIWGTWDKFGENLEILGNLGDLEEFGRNSRIWEKIWGKSGKCWELGTNLGNQGKVGEFGKNFEGN